ncbi:MAG: hypothetical protein ACLFPQ_06215 [Candidatus Woesearchaeota archaeon]
MVANNYTHEKGIDKIIDALDDESLDHIALKYEYGIRPNKGCNKVGFLGEIDVFASVGDTLLIFEYKSRDSRDQRIKAYQQLFSARKYFEDQYDSIATYYVHDDLIFEQVSMEELEASSNRFRVKIDVDGKKSEEKRFELSWDPCGLTYLF